jgi:hypothetical protein
MCCGLAVVVASQTRLRRFAAMNMACKALSRALGRGAGTGLLELASFAPSGASAATVLVDAIQDSATAIRTAVGSAQPHRELAAVSGGGAGGGKEVRLLRFTLTHLAALARHAPTCFRGLLGPLVEAFAEVCPYLQSQLP